MSQLNFHYAISVDYDTRIDETEHYSSCKKSGICRCRSVENVVVLVKRQEVRNFITESYDVKLKTRGLELKTSMMAYCVDRICAHLGLYNPDSYNVDVSPGYYGEEVGAVTIDSLKENKLESLIGAMKMKESVHDYAVFILKMKYGHVLPILKDGKWDVATVDINDVIASTEDHYVNIDEEMVEAYLANRKYDINMPVCIVRENKGKYYVVDDHARYCAAVLNGEDQIKVVCFKP